MFAVWTYICLWRNEIDGWHYWSRFEPEEEEWQRPTKNSRAMNGPAVVFYLGPSHFLTCPITIRGLEVTMGFVSAERRHLRLLVPRKRDKICIFHQCWGVCIRSRSSTSSCWRKGEFRIISKFKRVEKRVAAISGLWYNSDKFFPSECKFIWCFSARGALVENNCPHRTWLAFFPKVILLIAGDTSQTCFSPFYLITSLYTCFKALTLYSLCISVKIIRSRKIGRKVNWKFN